MGGYSHHPDENGVLAGCADPDWDGWRKNISGVGDWNGDGVPDLLVQYDNGTLQYYPISASGPGALNSCAVGVGFKTTTFAQCRTGERRAARQC